MKTPEDRFYNPVRINVWFALASLLVLATAVGAILQDHFDRAWKGYQEEFFQLERTEAERLVALYDLPDEEFTAQHRNLAARLVTGKKTAPADWTAVTPLDKDGFDAAVFDARERDGFEMGAVFAARIYEYLADQKRGPEVIEQRDALMAEMRAAEDARFEAEQRQRGLQAIVDELKFEMDHARSHGHPEEAARVEAEWKEMSAEEQEVHAEMDRWTRIKTEKNDAIKALLDPAVALSGRSDRLLSIVGIAAARRKLDQMIAWGLRNAPILDAVAPGRKIEQVVLPDLTVDYNFEQIGRVDRCMSCHKGIDKIRVVMDEDGNKEIIPLYTEENTPEMVFRTHSKPELYVSSLSPHSMDKVGCTVCHEGLGWGVQSFNDAYHTPSSPEQEAEWEEKYHWHRGESWTLPMLPMPYIEASCAKCHTDAPGTSQLSTFAKAIPEADEWNRGRELVERSGCFACHKVDGYSVAGLDKWIDAIEDPHEKGMAEAVSAWRPGPSLRRINGKWSSDDALFKWIWDPQSLRPTTNMPRFFGQPNNSGVDHLTGVDYDLRTRTEVLGIVAYLRGASEEWVAPTTRIAGNAERGKDLFGGVDAVGCLACHQNDDFPYPGDEPHDFGPDLSQLGSKTTEGWLRAWLENPQHYWSGTRMPSLRLSPAEAADIAAYLIAKRNPEFDDATVPATNDATIRQLAEEAVAATAKAGVDVAATVAAMDPAAQLRKVGERALQKYSCYTCHEISGFEGVERACVELGGGQAWGSKDVDRLDFGLLEDPKAVAQYGEAWGAKLLPHRKPEWAKLKLLNPRVFDAGLTKQPHEKLLMPNFYFTEDEADAVVTYLLSITLDQPPPHKRDMPDAQEAQAEKMRWLVRKNNCGGCHTYASHGLQERLAKDTSRPVWIAAGGDIRAFLEDPDLWPPTIGGEGSHGEGFKVQAGWLKRFLVDPADPTLRPWLSTRMPTFPWDQYELNEITHGFAAADRVAYPFEFEEAERLTGDVLEAAKGLFDKFQCRSCHPAGSEPAQNTAALAPDLQWTQERLRYEWVELWLENPAGLQPGTKMPRLWGADKEGNLRPGIKEYFDGDPREQIRRLADYVKGLGRVDAGGTR